MLCVSVYLLWVSVYVLWVSVYVLWVFLVFENICMALFFCEIVYSRENKYWGLARSDLLCNWAEKDTLRDIDNFYNYLFVCLSVSQSVSHSDLHIHWNVLPSIKFNSIGQSLFSQQADLSIFQKIILSVCKYFSESSQFIYQGIIIFWELIEFLSFFSHTPRWTKNFQIQFSKENL